MSSSPPTTDLAAAISAAETCVRTEADAVAAIADRLGEDFRVVVGMILRSDQHVVVTGLGKSGHVGNKIAATLASTGTPAFFMHATEALHGDAGMLLPGQVVVAISYSGETAEVCDVAAMAGRRGNPVVAVTSGADSRLAAAADAVLDVTVPSEGDPLDLAPMASTTVTLAFGDAVAAALMAARDVGPADFHQHHPAGALGRRLAGLDDQAGGR